jgi:hypothetical protein
MSDDDVTVWLGTMGLERYAASFDEEGFDTLDRVAMMTEEDISSIEGMKRGHKRDIQKHIALMVASAPVQPPLPPPASAESATAPAVAALVAPSESTIPAVTCIKLFDLNMIQGEPNLVIHPEATGQFESHPLDKYCPLNLVMIFGPARQGKSFFMNVLCRQEGLFRQSASAEPCTEGVDIATHFPELDAFERGGGVFSDAVGSGASSEADSAEGGAAAAAAAAAAADGAAAAGTEDAEEERQRRQESAMRVGFVDVEGQGDRGECYDAFLAMPLLLVSKVMVMQFLHCS